MPDTLLVRLKPYDKKKGHVLKTYGEGNMTFKSPTWYEVPRPVAEHLRQVHQKPEDLSTPYAFDVCTQEEAKHLQETERKARLKEADPEAPIRATRLEGDDATSGTMTTDDLPRNLPGAPKRVSARSTRAPRPGEK